MATPEPGDMIAHIHSRGKYWYVGKVPDRHTVVIYSVENVRPYEIGYDELNQYYEIVDLHSLEPTKSYRSQSTGSVFTVESIHIHPDNGSKVAFGFYQRQDSTVQHPFYVKEQYFKSWSPVS